VEGPAYQYGHGFICVFLLLIVGKGLTGWQFPPRRQFVLA
jgi:hypothetical protein